MRHSLFPLAFALTLAACSSDSHYIKSQRPVEQTPIPADERVQVTNPGWIIISGGESLRDFNPKVDILFVEDNSDSMRAAQDNLSKNINRFVEGFTKNPMIDYHIGVTSVWDSSERFLTKKKDTYKNGELRWIKNQKGQTLQQRFVGRFQGSDDILAATLKIGIAAYQDGGPENEELFSPILESIKLTGRGDVNEGFFRDDARLVVVLVTVADDVTKDVSPSQVVDQLTQFKGGLKSKISAYGILVAKEDKDEFKDYALRVHPNYHKECFTDGKNNGTCKEGFGPERLEQFVLEANQGDTNLSNSEIREQNLMRITDPRFGDGLAKIGSDLTVKTLAKEILLDQRPSSDKTSGELFLKVYYGSPEDLKQGKGQRIPNDRLRGWTYDYDRNSIKLSGQIAYQYVKGGEFAIHMIPLKFQ